MLAVISIFDHGFLYGEGIHESMRTSHGRCGGPRDPVRCRKGMGNLFGADEAFLTSTTRELVPIVTVSARSIGTGEPGPVIRTLLPGVRRAAERS